jgi:hypothetical protein
MKKSKIISILFVAVCFSVAFVYDLAKNKKVIVLETTTQSVATTTLRGLTFDSISPNMGKFLEQKDDNAWYLIRTFLAKDVVFDNGLETEEDKYSNAGYDIKYYDSETFIGGGGFYTKEYYLYNIKNGQKLNKSCSITTNEGYIKVDKIIVSGFPFNLPTNEEHKKGLCLYSIGDKDFTYIDLTSKLNKGETLIKYSEMYGSFYDYLIDTSKKQITISIFNYNKKDGQGINEFIRKITVSY